MNGRAVYHIARADFLERVRGYGFLGMTLFTIFVTYLFIPALDEIQIAGLQLGGYRSLYNSAWIGGMTTLLMGEFFLLFAFYLLKGVIERDRQTGIGQIIATTPVTRNAYLFGKWLSNVAVMTAMTLVIIVAAAVLQFARGEVLTLDTWALASPFLLVLLPALTMIAAVTLFFDSVNWLRGAVGSILFFFIVYPFLNLGLDLAGNNIIYPSMYQACAAQFDGCNPSRQIDAGLSPLIDLPTFAYNGVAWTAGMIATRVGVILLAALVVALAAYLFHRFDPAKADAGLPTLFKRQVKPRVMEEEKVAASVIAKPVTLTPISVRAQLRGWQAFWRVFQSEAKLTFNGIKWLWYAAALGALVAAWLTPLESARLIVLPLAWVLPLTLWSGMGAREARFHTEQIIFSTPFPLRRQLPVTWLVGLVIALIMGSGVIMRDLFAGNGQYLLAELVGAAFIPALALMMGVWSGGGKIFEGAYLFAWYLAAFVNVEPLDFMGRLPATVSSGLAWVYAALTLTLLTLAWLGRRQQLAR